ncbi:MAG: hypothetical protein VB089_08720 [Anaerolineaceae bacterium]|nr:hypothetical protein [Anaerolineaceae bacterium]
MTPTGATPTATTKPMKWYVVASPGYWREGYLPNARVMTNQVETFGPSACITNGDILAGAIARLGTPGNITYKIGGYMSGIPAGSVWLMASYAGGGPSYEQRNTVLAEVGLEFTITAYISGNAWSYGSQNAFINLANYLYNEGGFVESYELCYGRNYEEPEPEVTLTPTVDPASECYIDDSKLRDTNPAVKWRWSWGDEETVCQTLIPAGGIELPEIAENLLFPGGSITWPSITICGIMVHLPEIEIMGQVIPVEIVAIPALLWIGRRLLA